MKANDSGQGSRSSSGPDSGLKESSEAAVAASVAPKSPLSHLLLVLVAILLIDVAESSIQPYLHQYAVTLGAGAMLAGLSVSVHQLVRVVVGPLAGSWSDRVGKRRPFALGISILFVSYLVGFLAPEVWGLFASRLLVGVGFSLVSVTMMSQVGSCVSVRRRGLGYSLFINASAASMILAPLIGGTVSQLYGYRPVFAVSSVVTLCGIVFSVLLPSSVSVSGSSPERLGLLGSMRVIERNRNTLATAVELFGIGLGWVSFLSYVLPVYGMRALGLNQIQIGIIVSVVGVSHLVSSMISGPLSDRLRVRRPFVFLGITLAGATIFLMPLVRDFWGLSALVATFAFFVGLQCPTSLALVADSVEARFLGSAMGVISGIEMSGMFIGPVTCASVLTAYGLGYIHLIPALGMTIPGITFLVVSREHRNR